MRFFTFLLLLIPIHNLVFGYSKSVCKHSNTVYKPFHKDLNKNNSVQLYNKIIPIVDSSRKNPPNWSFSIGSGMMGFIDESNWSNERGIGLKYGQGGYFILRRFISRNIAVEFSSGYTMWLSNRKLLDEATRNQIAAYHSKLQTVPVRLGLSFFPSKHFFITTEGGMNWLRYDHDDSNGIEDTKRNYQNYVPGFGGQIGVLLGRKLKIETSIFYRELMPETLGEFKNITPLKNLGVRLGLGF